MFDALQRHRNVTPLLVGNVPVGPNALAARERMIAFLLANQFRPDLAARSYALLSRYVFGFAIQLTDSQTGLDDAGLARMFHDLDPSQFPATVAVADHLPVPFDEEFDFGLELIINGLAAALTRQTPAKKGKRRSR
jgi:TetR/AcrR family transcriptional regulator, tetracycline repressor protein